MKSCGTPIHFSFEIDKFIACVALLAQAKLTKLDKLKACKLLYYADKYHLLKYGRPIIGDVYVHLDNGPVPSRSLDIMNEVICGDNVYFKTDISSKEKFNKYLNVKKRIFHKYPIFNLALTPDVDSLSGSEIEAISETIKQYGNYSGVQLIEKTHKDASWQMTKNNQEIDYRLFFENETDANPEALEYLDSLQDDLGIGFLLSYK